MSDSEVKKATKALKRENEKLEAEKIRQDKEIAELLKKIKNV
jgi:FtsZ-binding cell division protein ZapB